MAPWGDFQNYAESARRDVTAGLEPDTICIRNPEAVILQVSNESVRVFLIRIEARKLDGKRWISAFQSS